MPSPAILTTEPPISQSDACTFLKIIHRSLPLYAAENTRKVQDENAHPSLMIRHDLRSLGQTTGPDGSGVQSLLIMCTGRSDGLSSWGNLTMLLYVINVKQIPN
jgi:hypothetical protein